PPVVPPVVPAPSTPCLPALESLAAPDPSVSPAAPPVAPPVDSPILVRATVGAPPAESSPVQPVVHIGRDPSWQGGAAQEPSGGQFGHAPDYGWLVGELQYLQTRHAWRLRYARPGDADRYGGTVTLSGDALPADGSGGQLVRIEGHLVNPD